MTRNRKGRSSSRHSPKPSAVLPAILPAWDSRHWVAIVALSLGLLVVAMPHARATRTLQAGGTHLSSTASSRDQQAPITMDATLPARGQQHRPQQEDEQDGAATSPADEHGALCPAGCHASDGWGRCLNGRCECALGHGAADCGFSLPSIYADNPVYDLTSKNGLRQLDLTGWSVVPEFFEKYLEKADASTVVEVGVWKGLSTAQMAKWLKRKKRGVMISIDTFLGAPEMWTASAVSGADPSRSLLLEHGFPSIYKTFLSNMQHEQLTDVVVPLPLPSKLASVVLKRLNVTADLIHVDAAHEYGSVKEDIHAWWPFVRGGGILLGDDWSWTGVQKAVKEFVLMCELEEFHSVESAALSSETLVMANLTESRPHPKWLIMKPAALWFAQKRHLPTYCEHGSTDQYVGLLESLQHKQ